MNDEWIEHDGGPCPLVGDEMAEITFRGFVEQIRDGDIADKNSYLRWIHIGSAGDITHYRIIKESST